MDTLINVNLTIISRQIHLELDFVYETLRCLSTGGEWTNGKKGRLVMFFIPNDFSLHFKATMTVTTNEILGGKQMQIPV
jgi:hypothetical protein